MRRVSCTVSINVKRLTARDVSEAEYFKDNFFNNRNCLLNCQEPEDLASEKIKAELLTVYKFLQNNIQLHAHTFTLYLHFVTVTDCNKSCLYTSKDDFEMIAFQFYDIVTFVSLCRDCEED